MLFGVFFQIVPIQKFLSEKGQRIRRMSATLYCSCETGPDDSEELNIYVLTQERKSKEILSFFLFV
jgi:hypothetical protein